MFTTPAHSAPTLSTTTSPASPTTPSRSTRLRGLSYIRQYTHNHLHVHAALPSPPPASPRPVPTRAVSSPSQPGGPLLSVNSTSASRDSDRPLPTHESSSTSTEANPLLTSGWLPTVAGRSALSRIPTRQHSLDSSAVLDSPTMTRNRAETAAPSLSVRNQSGPTPTNMDGAEHSVEGTPQNRPLPSIRFIPHHDPRAGRPSLVFPTISRTLPDDDAVIRVGRYSERDNIPEIPANVPSAAAVGFKSKVVSRKHCEFWCSDSQWYIRDVKSSSGTFLNHIRLSQPNQESKPFKVKDGDVVQLGIDFRGGEEMIFRCVKIRIECNRNWQQSINTFNKQTHQRLRNLAKAKKDTDSASTHSSECSICLMSIAPCQSLFVAPCSHVWHYKCIRPILQGPTWPNFLCPNCRAVTDLEADVEEPEAEDWDEEIEENDKHHVDGQTDEGAAQIALHASQVPSATPVVAPAARTPNGRLSMADLEAAISTSIPDDSVSTHTPTPPTISTPQASPQRLVHSPPAGSQPVHIVREAAATTDNTALFPNRSTSNVTSVQYGLSPERVPECPMTPRNDAGPFVFDGSGGRGPVRRGIDEASTPNTLSVSAVTTVMP